MGHAGLCPGKLVFSPKFGTSPSPEVSSVSVMPPPDSEQLEATPGGGVESDHPEKKGRGWSGLLLGSKGGEVTKSCTSCLPGQARRWVLCSHLHGDRLY